MKRIIHGLDVYGVEVDSQTRCQHYHTDEDIIAIKFACCQTYYPCRECHDAVAGHAAEVWPETDRAQRAILCGSCGHELTIDEYLHCDAECPYCGAHFNPRCSLHYNLYFDMEPTRGL